MRNQPCIWATLALVMCVGRATADEERVVGAFERLGAVVKRDDTKPNRPVIALRFGLLNPIPESTSEFDKDALFMSLMSYEVSKVTGASLKEGGKPPDQAPPTAIKITDADLKEVSKLEHLQELDLSYGEITNDALRHIKTLKNLQVLDLRNTWIDDAGLQMLKDLKSLKKLYLTSCELTDDGLVHLRELTNLEALFLGNNNATQAEKITDKGMQQLKELKNLQKLYLQYTKVTDKGVKELRELTNLRELNLNRTAVNDITDIALETIKEFAKLEVLSLVYTKVTDNGLKHLSGLQRLRILDLYGTQVTDEGMKSLRQLTNLRQLDLGATKLTITGLRQLKGFRRLEYLNLEQTQASGWAGRQEIKEALPKLDIPPSGQEPSWIYRFPGWYKMHWEQAAQEQAKRVAEFMQRTPSVLRPLKQIEEARKPIWLDVFNWMHHPPIWLVLIGILALLIRIGTQLPKSSARNQGES